MELFIQNFLQLGLNLRKYIFNIFFLDIKIADSKDSSLHNWLRFKVLVNITYLDQFNVEKNYTYYVKVQFTILRQMLHAQLG